MPFSPGDSQDAAAKGPAPSSAADRCVHTRGHYHLWAPCPGAGRAAGSHHERGGSRHLPGQGAQQEVGGRHCTGPQPSPPPQSLPLWPLPRTMVLSKLQEPPELPRKSDRTGLEGFAGRGYPPQGELLPPPCGEEGTVVVALRKGWSGT